MLVQQQTQAISAHTVRIILTWQLENLRTLFQILIHQNMKETKNAMVEWDISAPTDGMTNVPSSLLTLIFLSPYRMLYHKSVQCGKLCTCATCVLTHSSRRAPAPWWWSLRGRSFHYTGPFWWTPATQAPTWTWCHHSHWCWAGEWIPWEKQYTCHYSSFPAALWTL